MPKRISLIVPCFNEAEGLDELYRAVVAAMKPLEGRADFELWLVDDGSSDGSLEAMRRLRGQDSRVHFVSLSRNFGKEAAMLAGLEACGGDVVAVMDADLQDPPSLIPTMFELLESGEWDCVAARRRSRTGESALRSLAARLFYRLMSRLSRFPMEDGMRDFRMMTRTVVDAILSVKEVNRFSKGIFCWIGYRVKWLDYDHVERRRGKSKWSLWSLFKYGMEGIVSFSTIPLYLACLAGALACVAAFALCVKTLIKTLFFGEPVAGYTTILACMTFFCGLQFLLTGIVGLYVSKVYMEVKRRPLYLIKEKE